MDVTRKFHFSSYPAIAPTRPELSQAGRTILITGGGSGIGLAICEAFARAGAAHIILLGRRVDVLEEAKRSLLKIRPSGLTVSVHPCDIFVDADITRVWDQLAQDGVAVDVLVLNAGGMAMQRGGVYQADFVASVWSNFQGSVYSTLAFMDRFVRQGAPKSKVLVSVNSAAAHLSPAIGGQVGYAASRAGLGAMLQAVADSVSPDDLQIVSLHPGGVMTDAVRRNGGEQIPFPWNDGQLTGEFAVWAASAEARFLHGRYVWAQWDVPELVEKKSRFTDDPTYCRIGLQGPAPLNTPVWFQQIQDVAKQDEQKTTRESQPEDTV